jgi:hypothetical protein
MSPFRWDVLLVGLVLSLPVLALGLRGDLSAEEVANRVLWCLAAGWGVVAVLRLAATPRSAGGSPKPEQPGDAASTEIAASSAT